VKKTKKNDSLPRVAESQKMAKSSNVKYFLKRVYFGKNAMVFAVVKLTDYISVFKVLSDVSKGGSG
jgi:hypothetical protein